MKNRILIVCAGFFFSSMTSAAINVAVVNVTDLFNNSTYVSNANKKLQDNAKKMEETLKAEQSKLQQQVNDYQKMKDSEKKNVLAKSISEQQANIAKLTKEYQSNISTEQNKGMQEFNKLVQVAVQKIAKEKSIHTVLNSSSVMYNDNAWVDITKDVQAEMAKN